MQIQKSIKQQIIMKNTLLLLLLRRLGCLGCIFTAILLFSQFGSLQAQEAAKNQSRKTGWFAGSSYRLSPVELEITQGTREVTFTDTKVDTRTESDIEETVDVTITDPDNVRTRYEIEVTNDAVTGLSSNDEDNIRYLQKVAERICREGKGFGQPVTADPYPDEKWATQTGGSDVIISSGGCFKLKEVTSGNFITHSSFSTTTNSSSSSRIINNSTGADIQGTSNKIGGQNIYFGYNFEKFRVTFSDSRWNSGAAKIQSQMVFADWFLPRNLYAGFGIARSHLATSFGSDSSIKPVITFGKRRRLSQRLTVEIGFLYQQVELSVSNNSNNKPNNISLGTPSVGPEIVGEKKGPVSSSRTDTSQIEIRTTFADGYREALAECVDQVTYPRSNCPDDGTRIELAINSFPGGNMLSGEFKIRPVRIVTITGEQAEFITNTARKQEFKTTTTTEGTATQEQNEAKVTIPSTVFINIHLSF